jgi:MFS family permease
MNKSADPAEPKADFQAWWMLGLLLALYIISFIDRSMIIMLVDPIKTDLGLTDFEMSILLGPAFGVVYAIFGLPLGWAADKYSRRMVIFLGVFVWCLATTLTAFATTFVLMFLARMFVAIGEASLTPSAYSMISDRFPRKRLTTALSFYSMGPKAGKSVAYIVGGLVIGLTSVYGAQTLPFVGRMEVWQFVFLAVGLPGILVACLLFTVPEPPRRSPPKLRADGTTENVWAFLLERKRLFIPLLLGFCLVCVPSVALQTWIPTYMDRQFHWEPMQYGPAIGIISGLAAFSLPLKGLAVDWLYARGMRDAALRFYTWLLGLCIPATVIGFATANPYVLLVCYGFIQVIALPYLLYASSILQLLVPSEMRGRLTAILLFSVTLAGSMLGPTSVAALQDFVFTGQEALGLSLAIVSLICIATGWILLRISLGRVTPLLLDLDPISGAADQDQSAPPSKKQAPA